jgi:hypothetical protein
MLCAFICYNKIHSIYINNGLDANPFDYTLYKENKISLLHYEYINFSLFNKRTNSLYSHLDKLDLIKQMIMDTWDLQRGKIYEIFEPEIVQNFLNNINTEEKIYEFIGMVSRGYNEMMRKVAKYDKDNERDMYEIDGQYKVELIKEINSYQSTIQRQDPSIHPGMVHRQRFEDFFQNFRPN